MHNIIHSVIISFLLFTTVGYSRSVHERNKVHIGLGRAFYSGPWGRWCTQNIECGRGFCQGYVCQCYPGYITWRQMEVCNYQQRTKLTAFLVSFFVGILGIDWFVLSRGQGGYIVAGIFKMIISFGCITAWPLIIIVISRKKPRLLFSTQIIAVVLSLTSFIWWLTDWIRVLANVFYDGNGAPLQPWGYNYYNRMPYHI